VSAPLPRRTFLTAAAAGAAAVIGGVGGAVTGWRPWRVLVEFDPVARAAPFVALFTRPDSAAAIGRAYLEVAPDEGDVHHLTSTLRSHLPAGPLRAAVAQRVHDDFDSQRVVTVDGWVLSQTEARLCAIAALAG